MLDFELSLLIPFLLNTELHSPESIDRYIFVTPIKFSLSWVQGHKCEVSNKNQTHNKNKSVTL